MRAIDNAPPRAAGAAKRGRLSLAGGVCIALSLAWAGSAWATVDGIEFICPCELELRPATGEASVTFGVRNFRPTVTGALSVAFSVEHASGATTEFPGRELIVGPLAPDTESRRFTHRWPELSRFVEADASDPALAHGLLHLDETEADGGSRSVDRIPLLRQESGVSEDAIVFRSPDFLTDGDGDGVADANERLEGTDPADPESAPGESTLDVLVLHNEGYASKFGYAPHTRIHHLMTLASLAYEDSGTNIRLRTVGIVSMEDQDGDWDDAEDWNTEPTVELLERVGRLHGADINVYFRGFPPEDSNFGPGGGFANLGGHRSRGYMTPPARARFDAAIFYPVSAFVVAHEIGQVLGLDHPMQWGTVAGTFRWARGHTGQNALTTIMGNGGVVRFSDPDADCSASGCPYGAPRHEWNGADAVASLDAVRFQVARFREEKPDADGDNIVDPADRFPLDAAEWRDTDGDGIGNRADPDDDNDAVPDGDDRFPLDPMEWADIDDDGIGDNADPELPSEEVLIPDPVLRAIIEDELGLPPGTPIAAGDMASIDDIQMPWNGLPSGERVRSLEGLQHAGSLHTLTLRHGDVSDLSPLSGLERLGWLDLSFNLISDVSPLVGMPSLRSVVLGGNAIADISPLAGMNQLGWLELHLNYLDDASLEWLGGLTGLHRLNLSNQQGAITDIAPLADLRRLEHLELSDNPRLYDIGTISHFPELRTLYLNYMPVSDISALAGLTRLSRLHLSGTRVKNLDELTGLPELSVLFFWQNSVSDMAMFSKLRSLSVLHINYNQISDISALVDSPVLADDAGLWIQGNPLGREAIYSHVPLLEARGITVHLYDDDIAPAERHVPDGRLRAALAEAAGKPGNADDVVLFDNDFRYYIRWLDLSDLGIEDLTGLEHAHRLESVNLARNPIEDLSPLLGLASLRHVTLDAATLNGASFQRDIDALRARGVAVTSAETGQGMATADECRPGLLLAPGEDCVYPGTEERFAVDAGGTAAFLFGTFGESVEIVGRIGGTDYDLAASRRDGGVWRIDRVAGRTGAPADDSGTDASSDGGADAPGDFDLDDDNVSATGITFANGRFHVVDSGDEGDDKVYAYTASGQRDAAADFDLDAGNVDAGGIVFVNGRFHVTDRGDDKVYAYTASGQRDAAADFDLADYNNDPSGIAFANGRFYVTDWHNDKVYVYTGGEWPTTFEAGETLADLPTGDWTPDATSGGSFSTSGGAVTVQLDNGGYIEEGDYRYTCRGGGGCRIEDRRVTSGSIVRTSAGDGAPPSFVAACFASEIWYRDGAAIDPLTLPPAAGGDAPLTYSLEVMRAPEGFWELEPRPALIPGLAFDPATRRVEGAPINDTDWIQSYGLRYAVTDADGDTDELEFQIYLLPANSTYRTHGAMYDDSCDGFLTDAFTDSTGRTIRFRLQFGADWDLGRPRGVELYFHGNETGTEMDMLDAYKYLRPDSFSLDKGMLRAAVASPYSAKAGSIIGSSLNNDGRRGWLPEDARLIHELLQSDFGGNAAIDRDRIVFTGDSQGPCFINYFLQRYAGVYGGGFHSDCGCLYWGSAWPPNFVNPWSPTVSWTPHAVSAVAPRFKVFVQSTTGDFLYDNSVAMRDLFRDVLGFETRWDLDAPGGHCAAGATPYGTVFEWLSDTAPAPRILGSVSGDHDVDGLADAIDPDDDNDGAPDIVDALPLEPGEWLDTDSDGIGDFLDRDADGDGVENATDPFPLDPLEWADNDGDGIGDNIDLDDDNDGIPDTGDPRPLNGPRNGQLSFGYVHGEGLEPRTGGFPAPPKRADLHAFRPATVVYPEAIGHRQTYHAIRLGDGEDPVFEFMVDTYEKNGRCEDVILPRLCASRHEGGFGEFHEERLHVIWGDRNRNRDLTDDGPPSVMADRALDRNVFSGTDDALRLGTGVVLNVPYGTGELLPYRLALRVVDDRYSDDLRLLYNVGGFWIGQVPVPGAEPVLVGTFDANLDGVFNTGTFRAEAAIRYARSESGAVTVDSIDSAALDGLRDFACVDLDRDGELNDCGTFVALEEEDEIAPMYPGEPFTLDGRTCTIETAPTGHTARIDCP